MNPQDFRKLIKALNELTSGQIQDASLRLTKVRRKTEVIAEIKTRAQATVTTFVQDANIQKYLSKHFLLSLYFLLYNKKP